MDDKRQSSQFIAPTTNIKHWHKKCRSVAYQKLQKVSPKNVYEICTTRRLTVVESKGPNVCKILNI